MNAFLVKIITLGMILGAALSMDSLLQGSGSVWGAVSSLLLFSILAYHFFKVSIRKPSKRKAYSSGEHMNSPGLRVVKTHVSNPSQIA